MATIPVTKKSAATAGSSISWVQAAAVATYIGIILLCFFTPWGPRAFWTIVLPLLIVSIVLMGFNTWRRVCPLAVWASFGVRLKPKGKAVRHVPAWMEQWFFVIALGFLVFMLTMRLLLINGDGIWLGVTLIGLGILSAVPNYIYSGRTWCNFICPVGVVERIYTDPNSLRLAANSQCAKCTACKRNCPDIDQENGYWKDVALPSRRIAFYAFPGIVLAFYTYYYLRAGDWDAYFNGEWTRKPVSAELFSGPGFFFTPQVPAFIAAPLTLLAFGAVSLALFTLVERVVALRRPEVESRRHLVLTLAAFAAFNIFYVFAGAPTLQLIPGATRVLAFVVPLVATAFLVKRWRRDGADYVKERGARKLLAQWSFPERPPDNPIEVFAYFKGREHAHEAQLIAYRDMLAESSVEGHLTPHSLHMLEQLRRELSISDAEHRKIFAALSQEGQSHLDPRQVERRAQLDGYRDALSQALLHNATAAEIDSLRIDFGITPETHEALWKELHGDSSPTRDWIRRRLDAAARLRTQMAVLLGSSMPGPGVEFAVAALAGAQQQIVRRVVAELASLGNAASVLAAEPDLFDADPACRRAALAQLGAASDATLVDALAPMVLSPAPAPATEGELSPVLDQLLTARDPYQQASALMIAAQLNAPSLPAAILQGVNHEEPLVRETALQAALAAPRALARAQVETLTRDPDPTVRAAAADVLAALESSALPQAARTDSGFARLGTIEKILFLRRVPLFAKLELADLHDLARLVTEFTVAPEGVICRQGDLSDDLYVLIAGDAVVSVASNGSEKDVGRLRAGDVVGELSAFDRLPRSATVRPVAGPAGLLCLSGEDFRRFLEAQPHLKSAIMETITRRLRERLEHA